MDWIKLIEVFAPLIRDCFKSRDERNAANLDRVRNPSLLQTIRLRRALRARGVPREQLNAQVQHVIEQARAATDEELLEFINECSDVNVD